MEKIKLPRSSYEELTKIITAYGALNKPSGLDDIVQASGIGKTVVSANNAFLSVVEVIEGGHKKTMTSKGLSLSKALQHDMQEEIRSSWTEIVNENDFLTKMVQAVRIRKGMELSQLENHIAFSSGENKSAPVRTGARAVVEILLNSSLLKQDGDKVVFSDGHHQLESLTTTLKNTSTSQSSAATEEKKTLVVNSIQTAGGVSINIDLNIQAKPNELEGLGKKLKQLIEDLSNRE